jgi:hypothetical protein
MVLKRPRARELDVQMTSARKGRQLAVATAIVFVISSIFPVAAGLSRNPESFPRLWGILDVVIAFILVALAIVVAALFGRGVTKEIELAAYRIYRVLINAILVLLVVFFLAGDRVRWTIFLTGLAWRGWLLFYGLPAWIVALKGKPVAPTLGGPVDS